MEDDDDKHLFLLLPVAIFLITTIGGSMALNTPTNENQNLEDKNIPYSIKMIDNENQSLNIKNIDSKAVLAAPNPISQNISVQKKEFKNDSSTKWDLNGTKTVYLTSDNIIDKNTDKKFLKRVASNLKSNGINVIIDSNAPNPNQVPRAIKNAPKDSAIVVINYNCAGTIKDLTVGISGPQTNGKTDKGYLYEYAKDLNGIIYVNVSPDIMLTNCSYLPRAYDDEFSPGSFKGINEPAQYLLENKIALIDSIKPVYPIMGIERADMVSKQILTLL
jgi:hypothetical protein